MIPGLILASALVSVPSPEVDAGRFLAAVREVAGTAGTSSPLGPYDLTRVVWLQHAPNVAYRHARDEGPAMLVAKDHFRWLRDGLETAKLGVTAYNLAACWRLGLKGGIIAVKAGQKIQYADSVHNLYYEKKN